MVATLEPALQRHSCYSFSALSCLQTESLVSSSSLLRFLLSHVQPHASADRIIIMLIIINTHLPDQITDKTYTDPNPNSNGLENQF